MFSLIAAVGKNHELGKDGKLIFHLKEDMQFFRETTKGHKIVMGRKTWESLPGKLPGRTNIVISRHEFEGPDEIIHDITDFITKNKDTKEEIFVIGGGMVYVEFLKDAKKIYLTEVDAEEKHADAYFPDFDKSKYTRTVIKKGSQDDLTFDICLYQR